MGSKAKPHEFINGVEHKFCTKCKEWYTLDKFHNIKGKWDGLGSNCKECVNKRVRDKYLTDQGGEYKVKIEHKEIDGIEYKFCQKCKDWHSLELYSKDKHAWDGLTCYCKHCQNYREPTEYEKKHGLVIEKGRTLHKFENDIEYKFCRHCETWYELDNFFKNNKKWDSLSCKCKSCTRDRNNKYMKKIRKTPYSKIVSSIRSGISRFIITGRARKYKRSHELLGCDLDTARNHIESQFQDGMTWENHGQFGWHLDHIIPCSSFDLTDPKQQKKCFHYTNLQPLWWKDNLSKSNKILS